MTLLAGVLPGVYRRGRRPSVGFRRRRRDWRRQRSARVDGQRPGGQGFTLVHFSAQPEPFWDEHLTHFSDQPEFTKRCYCH